MRIELRERFQKDVAALTRDQRAALFDAMLGLPGALGTPHAHAGLGLRKIHPTGVWEARVGLGLRLVFTVGAGTLTLVRAGSHDEIRRYLRSL